MTAQDRLAPDPRVMLTELGDGTGVLLHLETKFYYTLNRTGVFVWKQLAGGTARTVEALAAELARAFRVAAENAEPDVAAAVASMLDEGLIRREPA
jgi:hypothetical protein